MMHNTSKRTYDFVGQAKKWFILSTVVLLISLGGLGIRKMNLGLEFKGGTEFSVKATKPVTVPQIRDALGEVEVHDPIVQKLGSDGVRVQTAHLGTELQSAAADQLAKVTGVTKPEVTVTDVGPKWGKQITAKAVRALIVFLLFVSFYIAVRFGEWKMAVCSLVALVHDIIATAGIYALTGIVVTPATMIALLTILGFSLYDTVIIFDRVKERTRSLSASGKLTYSDVANVSLNQVLVRSLHTSLISLLPVGSLLVIGAFWLGASTLKELALALFIGIAVGTYSSIFVATPLLAIWKEREPRWASLRTRIAARGGEFAKGGRPAGAPQADAPESEKVPSATVARPAGPRPPQKRSGKKKRKR